MTRDETFCLFSFMSISLSLRICMFSYWTRLYMFVMSLFMPFMFSVTWIHWRFWDISSSDNWNCDGGRGGFYVWPGVSVKTHEMAVEPGKFPVQIEEMMGYGETQRLEKSLGSDRPPQGGMVLQMWLEELLFVFHCVTLKQ